MNTKHPLSPHLQVYRLPLTAVLSILHRLTGVFLAMGVVLLVAACVTLAVDPDAYTAIVVWFGGWFGQIILLALTVSLYLHLCNGIRHLFWDAGRCFELRYVDAGAILSIVLTIALTVLTWSLAGINLW